MANLRKNKKIISSRFTFRWMQWMTRCNQYLILELHFLFVLNLSQHFPSSKLFILHIFAKYHHNPCLIAGHITFLKTFHKNITIQNTSKRGREEFEKNRKVTTFAATPPQQKRYVCMWQVSKNFIGGVCCFLWAEAVKIKEN